MATYDQGVYQGHRVSIRVVAPVDYQYPPRNLEGVGMGLQGTDGTIMFHRAPITAFTQLKLALENRRILEGKQELEYGLGIPEFLYVCNSKPETRTILLGGV